MTKYNGPIKEVKLVEKVTLTKEQAEAIEFIKTVGYSNDNMVNSHVTGWSATNTAVLNVLKVSEMAKALYIGYEIEPEKPKFQPEDKVLFHASKKPKINTLKDKSPFDDNAWTTKEGSCIDEEDFSKATQEEVYWYETLNRETVKNFRIGDIYIDREYRAEILENDRHVQLAQIWYADGDFKGLYPAESFKTFPKEQGDEHHQ